MDCIKHFVGEHVDSISNSDNDMAELSYTMYEIQKQFLEDILQSNWMDETSQLSLIGGIQINMDG